LQIPDLKNRNYEPHWQPANSQSQIRNCRSQISETKASNTTRNPQIDNHKSELTNRKLQIPAPSP
jgi:hypothetical protein